MSLYDLITTFETIGAFDIGLPFILIFTISFAIFQKIQLFGNNKKNIDLIVSLVLAFLAIRNIFLVEFLNRFLPNIAMFLIIILMFLLLLGTFGGKFEGFKGYGVTIAAVISVIFVIISLSSDLGLDFVLPYYLSDFFDYQTKAVLFFITGVVLVIYFATGESSTSGSWKSTLDELGEKFGFKKQ